ncbi:DUF1801 domain-containing protein [Luteimonas vadosa]|uniref:YdhG-like domain-containing protein n=1 Tax=Luteimonas vadosa TaxID=1165507 RepID=A0ABP9DTJ2_9GAMM
MAELKTKPGTESVAAFIDAVEDEGKRKDCKALVAMMRKATGCKPVLWGGAMVGFDRYRYRYDSGREGEWFIVGFAPRKQTLSVYIMPGFEAFSELRAKLGKHSTGRSCLYIKRLADVDMDVLEALIEASVVVMRTRHPG